jgi:hypothetical protein
VTQAFDVGSWWSKSVFHGDNANVVHYEVCDKHAGYFTGVFDRQASERVVRDLAPWRPAIAPCGGIPA